MNVFIHLLLALAITLFTAETTQPDTDGHLLVLNKSADTAWQINPSTGQKVAEYKTGDAPHEVAISPDRTRAVVSNYGSETPGHTLTVIDLVNRKVDKTVDLESYERPHGIRWFSDNRRVAVSAEVQQSVVVVNIDSGEILQSIETGQQGSHMVELGPKEETLFVPNIGSGTVSVLDLINGSVVKTLETGRGSEGITLTQDGGEVWVTNRSDNTVSIIDTESLEIQKTLQSGDFPIRAGVSPDGQHIAVSNARSSDVTVFNAKNGEKTATVSTLTEDVENGVPIGLVFSDDGSRLYVSNSEADQVVAIDTQSWSVTGTIPAGATPDGIAYFAEPH